MATKETLMACRRAYEERGCKQVTIIHNDGGKSGIVNAKAVAVVMSALKNELDRQIAELR